MGSSHFPFQTQPTFSIEGKIPAGPDAVNDKYFSFQKETWDWTCVVKWNEIFGNSVFCFTGFTTLLC